jgi:2,4-dienoyl-CoA reductase-like NADH-dependent reductase (Old Yellow Enzyme family)
LREVGLQGIGVADLMKEAGCERVAARIGAERLGIRVSPYGVFNGMISDDVAVEEVHEALERGLSRLGLVYIHVVDHQALEAPEAFRAETRAAPVGP